jgi:hypothetical protein
MRTLGSRCVVWRTTRVTLWRGFLNIPRTRTNANCRFALGTRITSGLPGAYTMGFNDGVTVKVGRATRPGLS